MDDITNSPLSIRTPLKPLSGEAFRESSMTSPDIPTMPKIVSDDEDDMGWHDEMATPPPSDDSLSSPTAQMEACSGFGGSPDIFSSSLVPPASPARRGRAPPSSPMRGRLCFGDSSSQSFLRLRDVPGTPRSLLQQRKRMMGEDAPRPSTAPEQAERRSNQNPFTPQAVMAKRLALDATAAPGSAPEIRSSLARSFQARTESVLSLSPAKPRAHGGAKVGHANVTRYAEEFEEIARLGSGEFGTVMLCRFRIDGTLYAIKKSNKPIAGIAEDEMLLREVFAHAAISSNPHIVRYFSAWHEDDHMLIQNEYCDGGSLEKEIETRRKAGRAFTESEVVQIMKHVALGLRCLHSKGLAHLDIKPGNIFMKSGDDDRATPLDEDEDDDSDSPSRSGPFDDVFAQRRGVSLSVAHGAASVRGGVSTALPPFEMSASTVFKIGDLGMVVATNDRTHVEEGDCRYMAKELLADQYDHLQKADIFSLGITVHELASCQPLPKNGNMWHKLRSGNAPHLERYSAHLNQLIELCLHPDPTRRPRASEILKHPAIVVKRQVPVDQRSKSQLARELRAIEMQRAQLLRQLDEAKGRGGPSIAMPPPPVDDGDSGVEYQSRQDEVDAVRRRNSAPPMWGRPLGRYATFG